MWVSEWVSDCCLMPTQQFFSNIVTRFNYFSIDDDEVRFVLDQHAKSWIFIIVLAHWKNIPRIDMLPYSDTLSWFRANQSLLVLLNAACLVKVVTRSLKQGRQGYDCRRLRPRCKGYRGLSPPSENCDLTAQNNAFFSISILLRRFIYTCHYRK